MDIELTLNGIQAERVQPLLTSFEERHKIRVKLRVFDWESAWPELIKMALYNEGAHISEIGTTWTSNLIRMNSLRKFERAEYQHLGAPEAFVPALWESCAISTEPHNVFAIPLISDPYVIAYRKDLLKKARVNEKKAFSDDPAMRRTLQKLVGITESPFVIPTLNTFTNLHLISSWVWGNGGNFNAPARNRVVFDQPQALQGMSQFFSLVAYMAPSARHLSVEEARAYFVDGKAAVTITGSELIQDLQNDPSLRDLLPLIGTARLPGIPFVGGSNLVIWKHTPYALEKAALKLLEHLTSPEVQQQYFQATGLPPARNASLDAIADTPFNRTLVETNYNGRAFASVPLWGLIEDKLNAAFERIWQDIFSVEEPMIDAILAKHLIPIANRLNITLDQ